jgi:hypothetical protein
MAKVETWRFVFWTLWKGERGQTFAQRFEMAEVSEARRSHGHALAFAWAVDGMGDPSVSDLLASSGNGERAIATGGRRDDPGGPVRERPIRAAITQILAVDQ